MYQKKVLVLYLQIYQTLIINGKRYSALKRSKKSIDSGFISLRSIKNYTSIDYECKS